MSIYVYICLAPYHLRLARTLSRFRAREVDYIWIKLHIVAFKDAAMLTAQWRITSQKRLTTVLSSAIMGITINDR